MEQEVQNSLTEKEWRAFNRQPLILDKFDKSNHFFKINHIVSTSL